MHVLEKQNLLSNEDSLHKEFIIIIDFIFLLGPFMITYRNHALYIFSSLGQGVKINISATTSRGLPDKKTWIPR